MMIINGYGSSTVEIALALEAGNPLHTLSSLRCDWLPYRVYSHLSPRGSPGTPAAQRGETH
eukprot:8977588-Pyramimonas_sp.AAC.1